MLGRNQEPKIQKECLISKYMRQSAQIYTQNTTSVKCWVKYKIKPFLLQDLVPLRVKLHSCLISHVLFEFSVPSLK